MCDVVAATEYCFLWINWWPLCMTKAEWSGWAQAIGTVAAIIAGIVVAILQAHLARVASTKEAAERRLQATLTLMIVCESSCRRVEVFRANMRDRDAFSDEARRAPSLSLLAEMESMLRSTDAMPLFEVSHETARMALAFRTHLRTFMSDATQAMQHSREMDGAAFEGFFKAAERSHSLLTKVLGELERLSERLHASAGEPEIYVGEDRQVVR